jgi:cyclic beta-1,2-glucan synthetase
MPVVDSKEDVLFPATWSTFADHESLRPLRAELFGLEDLESHAKHLGGMMPVGTVVPGRDMPALFRRNAAILKDAQRHIAEAYRNREPLGNDAEWLLDNFHIVNDALTEVQTDLPTGYYRRLPKLTTGPLAGLPRVYALALELTIHSDSCLDEANITRFVQAFQTSAPLTVGEVWAIPIMLRLCLVENLRRLAEHILQFRAQRQRAQEWIATKLPALKDRIADTGFELDCIKEDWRDCYVVHLLEHMHDHAADYPEGIEALEKSLRAIQFTSAEVLSREKQRQAANQVSIANCVTSLRLLSALDWPKYFEETSRLEAELRRDPAGVYAQQDFATRDRCRARVEKLAFHSGIDELIVARLALQAARDAQSQGAAAPRDHVGYYLIDAGTAQLEATLRYRPPMRDWLKRALLAYPSVSYFGGLVLVIALALGVLAWLSVWLGSTPWLTVLVTLAALLPVSELAVSLINWLITAVLPPRTLASLDFEHGIPTEYATFVVIPGLLTSHAGAAGLVERLEIHYLANSEKNLFFGLLTDHTDAPTEQMPDDKELLQIVIDGIELLNRRYAAGGAPLFFLFHRPRKWNAAQGCWMGWERKRGKLAEFNRLLRGATDTSFVSVGDDWDLVPPIRYVITLDADTQLPRETARRLIALMAHPLNQPRFDHARSHMVRGYAIIQPRIVFSARSVRRSWFASILGGSTALDPYATATSDTYQDLFGSGSFTGKGIYDIEGFEAAAGKIFPDNHILSHDLIEGNYARCALATNIELLDDFPANYLAYLRREHRWIRGDWQILPWLFRWVPGPAGESVCNPLGMLERWKILDNLRRSVIPIALIVLLGLGWTVLPGSPWLWSGLAALVLFNPLLIQLMNALLANVRSVVRGRPFSIPTRDMLSTAGHVSLTVAFLPAQAFGALDAIARTQWRLFISKANLLEWESSALTERRYNGDFAGFARTMWAGPVLAVGLVFLTAFARPEALVAAGAFLFAWFVSPWIGYVVSRPSRAARPTLTAADEEELRQMARKTWHFFETFVGAEDHWLPPDNYQEDPKGEIAHRTSPTNIGMYLLCCVAAHDFGFLNFAALVERLERTLATLGRMEQAHGHFYNWYDTQNLQPLLPIYLSTVDSGNLAACLITLKQSMLEKIRIEEGQSDELARRGRSIAMHADALAKAMDFTMLYHAERNLFAVGYNLTTGRIDNSHYDLLASEASLTSFLAIARGEAPRKHWFHLGRPLTQDAGRRVLISWGGTMFEYLMPRLMLPIDADTLLGESQIGAVAVQIDYGRQCGTPWGISESAFSAVDGHFNYQYQAFGAPALGLKRGLGKDLVVAPYATGLALMVDAPAALKNLRHLREEGAEGQFGYYEAIDFTTERLPKGRRSAIVKCYMAHHQGMILVALANCLLGNPMPRRFRAEPMVRATELLLQERVPGDVPLSELQPAESALATFHEIPVQFSRRITTPHTAHPRTHLLASARYAVMVTNAGGSVSTARGVNVTRWREDATSDAFGQFLYLRDFTTGKVWSATHQPLGRDADEYEVIFAADKVEFRRLDGKIETRMEITVSPEHHAEVRRVIIVNHDQEAHDIELTSYAEIVLLAQAADEAHPAFGKLFLETEQIPGSDALLCRRRPRSSDQKPIWCVQAMTLESPSPDALQFETDRARFLGRGRTPADPAALDRDAPPLSGTVGAVLDPIFSLRRRFRVTPEIAVQITLTTGLADSREEAIALANSWKDYHSVNRAFDLAWAHTQVELRQQHWTAADTHLFQRLAGHVVFAGKALRASPSLVAKNALGQTDLWHLGISGDLPIILLRIASTDELPLARQVVTAHSFWRIKGLSADLVILNDEAGGYFEDLQQQLQSLVRASEDRSMVEKPGGAFVRKTSQISAADLQLLQACARCVLVGSRGMLGVQLDRLERSLASVAAPKYRAARTPRYLAAPADLVLKFDNGTGGFTPDGKEYIVRIASQNGRCALPPQPWCNVIANAEFGCLVSASGGGFTWAGNSQMNRLTPWRNDPVSDTPSEVIYLRDETSREFWSATPLPRGVGVPYTVRHGQGYTIFLHQRDQLGCELTIFVARDAPIKFYRLRIRNLGTQRRRLSALFYAELVLGTNRSATAAHVVTELDAETGALLARNTWQADRKDKIAFVDVTQRPRSYTADRAEFIGRNGSLAAPAACASSELLGSVGACLDPCAALQTIVHLNPQEEAEVVFVLGEADNLDAARRLIRLAQDTQQVREAWDAVTDFWNRFTTALIVRTPNAALDMLVNRWLPYQSLSCRMWGRSALYQSGGAFGFRDQLQDSMGLVYAHPAEARRHILRAARHQFQEGDAQHWWHEPSGAGVRTRCSDDFLWLPFVVHHYVTTTGDHGLLDEAVEFLTAPELLPDQEEDYRIPTPSSETATIFEHCVRAIKRGLRFGVHGLPLIGAGDWNDGMNRVGIEGRGESVWLGWFLLAILRKFADLCETRGNVELAQAYREQARELNANLEAHAWDGAWYRRAFFDDGRPLGSAANEECRIDSLPQSWGVISGGADPDRVRQGMAAVNEHLVRRNDRLVLLFTPPFDKSDLEPGYIKGYVPGIRENGGQYTHGALWVAQAWALLGDGDRAVGILDLLNPILHANSPAAADRYGIEPYVVAADVYGQPPHVGRGGWSWYTGSASWFYRVAIEAVLGFELLGDHFRLQPRLPASWPSAELTYRYRSSEYHIRIVRADTPMTFDDQPWSSNTFPLHDDGKSHSVVFPIQ